MAVVVGWGLPMSGGQDQRHPQTTRFFLEYQRWQGRVDHRLRA